MKIENIAESINQSINRGTRPYHWKGDFAVKASLFLYLHRQLCFIELISKIIVKHSRLCITFGRGLFTMIPRACFPKTPNDVHGQIPHV